MNPVAAARHAALDRRRLRIPAVVDWNQRASEVPVAMRDPGGETVVAKRANPSADTSALEREIDQLVYQLYGLTEDEIAIVEGS